MVKSTYCDYFIDIQDISSPARLLYLLTWFTWQKVANVKNCLSVVFLYKSKVSNFVLKLLNYYKINLVECLEKWGGTGGVGAWENRGRESMGDRRKKGGKGERNSKRQAFVICYCLSSSPRNEPNNVSRLPFNILWGLKQNLSKKSLKTKIRTRDKKKTAILQVKMETFPSCLHHRSWMRWNDTCANVSTVSVVSVSPLSL